MSEAIYLDYNASTPLAPEVWETMQVSYTQHYGNPSSQSHAQGWAAAGAVAFSRQQVADLLRCHSSEIIFTSGATESTNLALWGFLQKEPQTHIFTSNAEHAATYEVALAAQKKGTPVTFWPCEKDGLVSLENIEASLQKSTKTKLVSLIWANNEFGSLYDLNQLSKICQKHQAYLHIDATQALLTEPIDLSQTKVDFISFSAHKIYGPKGSGGLYMNKQSIGHGLEPLIYGGRQEWGLRSGTLNTPGIVGLGKACALVQERHLEDKLHFHKLYQSLEKLLETQTSLKFILNGSKEQRIFHNFSVTFPEYTPEKSLSVSLAPFCLSQGSACGTQQIQLNRALSAIGLNEKKMQSTLRISFGRPTTVSELEKLVEKIQQML